jgi:hypothetical protein
MGIPGKTGSLEPSRLQNANTSQLSAAILCIQTGESKNQLFFSANIQKNRAKSRNYPISLSFGKLISSPNRRSCIAPSYADEKAAGQKPPPPGMH